MDKTEKLEKKKISYCITSAEGKQLQKAAVTIGRGLWVRRKKERKRKERRKEKGERRKIGRERMKMR